MLTGAALDVAVASLPSRPWRHTFVRAMLLAYARDPLGKGRPIGPQRFNVASGARMLYLADDVNTCLQEAQMLGAPLPAVAAVPVQFELKAVVDLRSAKVRSALHATPAELSQNFRSTPGTPTATQLLGESCAASGRFDGLLFDSSARRGHACLAVIEDALATLGSSLLVEDPKSGLNERLP